MSSRSLALHLGMAALAAIAPIASAQQPPKTAATARPATSPSSSTVQYVKVVGVDYSFTSPDASPAGIVNSDGVLAVKLRLSFLATGCQVDMAPILANSAGVSGVNRRAGSGL